MSVFVLSKTKKPLMPCSEKRARKLLEAGRAVVVKMYPFTIRLKGRTDGELQPLRIKLDPGSKHTGLAVVRDIENVVTETGEIAKSAFVLNLIQLNHRGLVINGNLQARAAMRGRRRSQLRYRPAHFHNRTKPKGWIAPSLQHRVNTVMSWVNRLIKIAPIQAVSQELVRFDMQKIENPEISGIEYQRGELAGYEVKEYLLNKWGRKCAYCNVEHVPLEIEHMTPKALGGSNRVSNLTLACSPCNQKKGSVPIEKFLANKPELLAKIKAQAKRPLKDAAAVNSTRWALANALKATGLTLELASGGKTKYNRVRCNIPKAHALDAACVGHVENVLAWNRPTLEIKCTGRGSYQRTRLNKFGFPRGYLMRRKSAFGFQTGDIVKAVVMKGKKIGEYVGRVAIRASGRFNITTLTEVIQGISYKSCKIVQRADGYSYLLQPMIAI